MRDHFEMMEQRRLLYTLRFKKGSSVCGEREPCIIRKQKAQGYGYGAGGGTVRSSMNRLKSSRRSLSIYSERPRNNAGEDDKRFEWKYRVKDRDHIPDFFPVSKDNSDIEDNPVMRFHTPEKFTYHLPKEQ